MIAVDTNILVYAHREDSQWHAAAHACIAQLAENRAPWAIPWPCIHEFLALATHIRVFKTPTPLKAALGQVEAWLESPTLVLLAESESHWRELRGVIEAGRVSGPMIHDAKIAAICRQHGVDELWTADRDFSRFSGLNCRNPLLS